MWTLGCIFENRIPKNRKTARNDYTDPHTRLANPTMIPDAKIAYPALRDSASYIFEDGTLSNLVCRMIATITPYIATASQKITLWQENKDEQMLLGHFIVPASKSVCNSQSDYIHNNPSKAFPKSKAAQLCQKWVVDLVSTFSCYRAS